MMPREALEEAKRIKSLRPDVSAGELDDLAQSIIAERSSADTALWWAYEIGTHVDEMAEIVVESGSAALACEWIKVLRSHHDEMAQVVIESGDVLFLVKYCFVARLNEGEDVPFKTKAVELDRVAEFVIYSRSYRSGYSTEDFYSNLPLELRFNIRL